MAGVLAFANNMRWHRQVHSLHPCGSVNSPAGLPSFAHRSATASSLHLEEAGSLPPEETVWASLHPQYQRSLEEVIYCTDKGVDVAPSHSTMTEVAAQLAAVKEVGQNLLQR